MCENGGKSFQAIFGARTPLIESFLIKRKLMGPCWVTVRNPKVSEMDTIFFAFVPFFRFFVVLVIGGRV